MTPMSLFALALGRIQRRSPVDGYEKLIVQYGRVIDRDVAADGRIAAGV